MYSYPTWKVVILHEKIKKHSNKSYIYIVIPHEKVKKYSKWI
jgi:hypothetical protein